MRMLATALAIVLYALGWVVGIVAVGVGWLASAVAVGWDDAHRLAERRRQQPTEPPEPPTAVPAYPVPSEDAVRRGRAA